MDVSYQDVKDKLDWGESNELEFKPEPSSEKRFEEDVFQTVVGMSNTTGGTLVIGVTEAKIDARTTRKIVGVKKSASDISDRLMQLVNEYLEPTGIKYQVYPIESTGQEPKLVGIDVERVPMEHFAVRYDGIASQKVTSYSFFLRLNGETRRVNFETFQNSVRGNLMKEMKSSLEPPKQPDLAIQVQIAYCSKRTETASVTTVSAIVRFDNKGDAYTTVHTARLAFEYKGKKYDDIPAEDLDITVMGGTSTRKQLIFQIPTSRVDIKDNIEKATITIIHTQGEKQIALGIIKWK